DHGRDGIDAIGAPTVGDDVLAFGNFAQAAFQLRYGNRQRAGNVPGEIFLLWPHVDHGDVTLAHAPAQLLDAHRFQLVASVDVEVCNLFDFCESTAPERFEVAHKPIDIIGREAVIDEGGIAPGL